ncbi:MAG TPA: phage tail protein, partial [Blastocatellia bacterium]|nr:phage tail protein [Blastocatellia bacterium]
MAKFTVNAKRYDPYRNFKFKIKIDNVYVAGLSKCSALKKTTEMVEWREGGDPSTTHKLPGKTKYDAITLTAGATHDTTFEAWANQINNFQGDAAMSLKNFRKDIIIDVFNEAGQKVLS